MKLAALVIVLIIPAAAQTVQCRLLGKYKGWPVYEVAMLAHPENGFHQTREEILSYCPVPMLPNTAAIDIVTNSYKRSSATGALLKQLAVWGGAALVGTGATANDRKTTYVGGALMLINGIEGIISATRFDPTRYLSDFVPARVDLDPGAGKTSYAVGVR